MKLDTAMKKTLFILPTAVAAFMLAACGGGSSDNSGIQNSAGGLAPDELTEDMILSPLDANVKGVIFLQANPARVAYFNSVEEIEGYPHNAYTGNYTYTKCGPNMAELKVVNVRFSPIESTADPHFTLIGYLTFVDANKVVFTGTETLVNSGGGENDPYDFGGGDDDPLNDTAHDGWGGAKDLPDPVGIMNVLTRKEYWVDRNGNGTKDPNEYRYIYNFAGGGSRNFSLNYELKKGE